MAPELPPSDAVRPAVAVLGAGSWGTALAKLLADQGHSVMLWARREDQALAIQDDRENKAYLPGFKLPPSLTATSDLRAALAGADLVVSVVPSHGLRHMLREAQPHLPRGVPIVSASKGIENATLLLVSQIFEEFFPRDQHHWLSYLSGPSFAKEVAAGLPTAVSVAGIDAATVERVQLAFATDRFRVYSTDDVIGVEIGGALKNVIAIGAGMVEGLGFGHNTRAALITRGLAEIARLGVRLGANPLTLAGLAGMGDLVLTCTGDLSRNRSVGLELGRGRPLSDVLGSMTQVAEGVRTTRSTWDLATKLGVDMPIVGEIYQVLYEGKTARDAVTALMTRAQRPERD